MPADPGSPSPGEIGGIFAGVVALLATIGGGIRWALNWKERRANSRAAKLQLWHEELKQREADLDVKQARFEARLEEKVQELQRENRAFRIAFQLVSTPLRELAPTHPALIRAGQVLAAAIPLDIELADDLEGLLAQIK